MDIWVATVAVGLLGFLGAGAGRPHLGVPDRVRGVGPVRPHRVRPPGPPGGRRRRERCRRRPRRRRRPGCRSGCFCSFAGQFDVLGHRGRHGGGAAVLLFATRSFKGSAAVLAVPVASYLTWLAFIGRRGLNSPADHFSLTTVTTLPGYVWFGLSSALGTTFNLEAAGTALLVGLAAWVGYHIRPLWRESPVLLGLFLAGVAFYAVAGFGRDTTAGATTVVSRYVYVGIAILLPVIAKVLSSASGWPVTRLAVIVLLAVTALGDVGQAQAWAANRVTVTTKLKAQLVATAQLLVSGVKKHLQGPLLRLSLSSLICRQAASRGSSGRDNCHGWRLPPSNS